MGKYQPNGKKSIWGKGGRGMNKELKSAMKQLTKENRKIIYHMEKYFGSHYLNEVCYDELLSDVVGMAIECQKRGDDFSEAVGMDYELFCHELALNIPKQSMVEKVFSCITWILYAVGIVIPCLFIYSKIFDRFTPAVCDGFLITASLAYFVKYTSIATLLVFGRYFFRRSSYSVQLRSLGIYVAFFLLFAIAIDNLAYSWFGTSTISIHIIVWFVIFAILITLAFLAKRFTALGIAYSKRKKDAGFDSFGYKD